MQEIKLNSMFCSVCAILREQRKQPVNGQTEPGVDDQAPIQVLGFVMGRQREDWQQKEINRVATYHRDQ